MRRVLVGLTILIVISVLISGAIVFLIELHPFDPGDLLFPIQELAEQIQYSLVFNDTDRAHLAIDLAFRRLEGLQRVEDEADVTLAAEKFESALDLAIIEVTESSLSEREDLIHRLNELLAESEAVLQQLVELHPSLQGLLDKVRSYISARSPEQLKSIADPERLENAQLEGESVPFFGEDFDHSFFLLLGTHESVDCADCHTRGQYAGTPTECLGCHLPPSPL